MDTRETQFHYLKNYPLKNNNLRDKPQFYACFFFFKCKNKYPTHLRLLLLYIVNWNFKAVCAFKKHGVTCVQALQIFWIVVVTS